MILKDLKLFAMAAALFVLPTCAFIASAAWSLSAPVATACALLVALAICWPMAGRIAALTRFASASHWRRAMDAGFWMLAMGTTPVLAFLVHAFGGISMLGAFAVALITFPLNIWQFDDALVGMHAEAGEAR